MDGKWPRDQQIVQFESLRVDHKALCHLVKSFPMAFRNIIGWKQMFPSGGRDDTRVLTLQRSIITSILLGLVVAAL